MSATKTLAFVLKTQDYRDTSLLADLYTREHGKIKGVIRGIRDTRARFGSTLEPFSLNEILFYKRRRGGDLHQVTHAELVDLFPAVRDDLERLGYATYFVELLDELVEGEEPSEEIFDLLTESLAFLASGASPRRCARVYEVKLFGILGMMPEIHECVVCRRPQPDPAFFNVALGGIRCRECSQTRAARPAGQEMAHAVAVGIPVSKGAINFIDHVCRQPVRGLYNVKVSQEVGAEVERMLRKFVDFHLPSKLKSVVFLEKMGYN